MSRATSSSDRNARAISRTSVGALVNEWLPRADATSATPPRADRRSSGLPKGSFSPCMTASRVPATVTICASAARDFSGFPGGCSGKDSASTASAPTASAVRQATRAPALRPPTTNGRGNAPRPDVSSSMTASHATSSWAGGVATARPATRHGCSTSTTSHPCAVRAVNAWRSADHDEPPAPCPRTSDPQGRDGRQRCASAIPTGVWISLTLLRTATSLIPR